MKAYKLVRLGKDGLLYPLFINKHQPFIKGEWQEAQCYATKGFAVRKGWHCTLEKNAPHLKETLASGEKRVWITVEVEDVEYYNRPQSQGGTWVLAQRLRMI